MSDPDAWTDIQAIKSRQSNLRAKMLQRRKEREGIAAEITKSTGSPSTASSSDGDFISCAPHFCSII